MMMMQGQGNQQGRGKTPAPAGPAQARSSSGQGPNARRESTPSRLGTPKESRTSASSPPGHGKAGLGVVPRLEVIYASSDEDSPRGSDFSANFSTDVFLEQPRRSGAVTSSSRPPPPQTPVLFKQSSYVDLVGSQGQVIHANDAIQPSATLQPRLAPVSPRPGAKTGAIAKSGTPPNPAEPPPVPERPPLPAPPTTVAMRVIDSPHTVPAPPPAGPEGVVPRLFSISQPGSRRSTLAGGRPAVSAASQPPTGATSTAAEVEFTDHALGSRHCSISTDSTMRSTSVSTTRTPFEAAAQPTGEPAQVTAIVQGRPVLQLMDSEDANHRQTQI